MVSKRVRAEPRSGGTLALDAPGLSLHVDGDGRLKALIAKAAEENARVAISSVTPLEVRRAGEAAKRLAFLLSRIDVRPATDDVIDLAAGLLDATDLSGRDCLVDALVVATAGLCTQPVRLVTSDRSHIPKLCQAAAEAGHPVSPLFV
ncbi:hypothetical protein AB0M28_07880 [Streptomyces sp. NPDC051940]|uniref:hypothetical protein n=1 Tax=Streptomyces sp. NPDC051940 TaxID=3155675 RepID=UPI003414184B